MIPKRKPRPVNDGTMTLVEHIEELRRRLLVALAAIAVGTVVGYFWYGYSPGPVPSLGDILKEPYCSLPADLRFGSSTGECRLLATSPFEMFVLRLKVGALAGIVFSSPIWIGQIWGYITPGLKKSEKRWTMAVGLAAGFLFAVGAVLAYFVLSEGLQFLMMISDGTQIAALNGKEYFGFAVNLLLIFGVSFEVPLLTVLLNFAGVVRYQQLKEKRRYIIVVLFCFAAFVTPGQDPISMVCLASALCVMMEIATQIARVNDRRRAKQQPEWLEQDDDETAPIAAPAPVRGEAFPSGSTTPGYPSGESIGASPVPAPAPVAPAAAVPGTAEPAPRSSSAARPRVEPYGRREGLDLTAGARGDAGSVAPAASGNGPAPAGPASTGGSAEPGSGSGSFYDDVL